jgi:hypothetical protein
MVSVSDQDFEHMAAFQGYGNPDGKYWFIGLEEGIEGESDPTPEIERRRNSGELVDLARAREKGGLDGDPNWKSPTGYKEQHLGRLDGDTFLTELYPLPTKNHKVETWPYVTPYTGRLEYEKAVLPSRTDLINSLWSCGPPEFVFCYGKEGRDHPWDAFQTLFPAEYESKCFYEDDPKKRHDMKIGCIGTTIVVLMHHFNSRKLNYDPLGELVDTVIQYKMKIV